MNIYSDDFDLNKFKAFNAVAEYSSFSEAAKELHITQPAISYSIKQLEQQLKTKLFIRDKRKIYLTDEGKQLKIHVEKAFDDLLMATSSLKDTKIDLSGEIKIGIYSHIGCILLAPIIKKFLKLYPNVKFTIFSSTDEEMKMKFQKCELDILILHYPIFENNLNYKEKIITKYNTCFFANEQIANDFYKGNNNFFDFQLLLPMKGFITSLSLEKIFKDKEMILKSNIYLYTTEMTIALVKEGVGIGWCIRDMIEIDLENKKLYEIDISMEPPILTFSLAHKFSLTSTLKTFIKFIENEVNNVN